LICEVAVLVASMVDNSGQLTRALRALERHHMAELRWFDRQVDVICEIIRLATQSARLGPGPHQPGDAEGGDVTASRNDSKPNGDVDGLAALLAKANDSKRWVELASDIRKLLERRPELWRFAGSLAHIAARHLIRSARGAVSFNESVARDLMALEADLKYQKARPFEKLLIEQVILCRLRVNLLAQPSPASPLRLTAWPIDRELRRTRAQQAFRLIPSQAITWISGAGERLFPETLALCREHQGSSTIMMPRWLWRVASWIFV
jgi:hypothetical protein